MFGKKLQFLLLVLFGMGGCVFAQLELPGNDNLIITQDPYQVLNVDGIGNPIRDGAYRVVVGDPNDPDLQIKGLVTDGKIEDHTTAYQNTLNIIKNFVNYALGLLSLIALIYLIYHGILILTAAGDDNQYKKGLKSVQFAAIALAGIGLSRLFISLIFWLILQFTSS